MTLRVSEATEGAVGESSVVPVGPWQCGMVRTGRGSKSREAACLAFVIHAKDAQTL